MCVVSAVLAAQAGGAGAGFVCRDGTRLEPGELLAAEALLPFAERNYIAAMRGEAAAQRLLKCWLWQLAAGRAAEERWTLQRGKPRLEGMAWAVCRELVEGRAVADCEVAARMEISRVRFYPEWAGRLDWLREEGAQLARLAAAGMAAAAG